MWLINNANISQNLFIIYNPNAHFSSNTATLVGRQTFFMSFLTFYWGSEQGVGWGKLAYILSVLSKKVKVSLGSPVGKSSCKLSSLPAQVKPAVIMLRCTQQTYGQSVPWAEQWTCCSCYDGSFQKGHQEERQCLCTGSSDLVSLLLWRDPLFPVHWHQDHRLRSNLKNKCIHLILISSSTLTNGAENGSAKAFDA